MSKASLLFSLILLACLFNSVTLLGQDSPNANSTPSLPEVNITPSNPETASLGRFGNVPINTATGKMSFSVPIHNIRVDGNSVPISLEYSYGGLILESGPSMTGLGWNLNAYGSVNRMVRGLPDGKKYGYYGDESKTDLLEQYENSGFSDDVFSLQEFYDFQNGLYDMELDKYSVNIGAIQFSFKILKDDQGNPYPYYLSNHNYKVIPFKQANQEFSIDAFEVIDDRGVRYVFNADDVEHPVLEPGGNDPEYNVDYKLAWVLSEIHYLNGETISFEYASNTFTTWNFSAAGAVSKSQNVPGDNPTDSEGYEVLDRVYQDSNKASEMQRKVLTNIYFPKGEIQVNTYIKNNHTLYQSIDVLSNNANNGTELINSFELSHIGPRDCLIQITKNDELYYGFDYNSQNNLPSFFESTNSKPLAQDYWHFYNGEVNNAAFNLGGEYTANKSSNFSSAVKGALSSITYPTGGETQVYYESNEIAQTTAVENASPDYPAYNKMINVELNPAHDNSENEVYFEYTFDHAVPAAVIYSINGEFDSNHLKVSLTRLTPSDNNSGYTSGNGCYFGQGAVFPLDKLTDKANHLRNIISEGCTTYPHPTMLPTFEKSYEPGGVGGEIIKNVYETSSTIYIEPGTYAFEISTLSPEPDDFPTFHNGYATAKIQLFFNDEQIDNSTAGQITYNKSIGGIRVARIVDIPLEGNSKGRIFKYQDPETGLSSGKSNYIPLTSTSVYADIIETNGSITKYKEDFHSLGAFSFLNEGDGIPVYYETVDIIEDISGSEQYVFVPATGDELEIIDISETLPSNQNPNGSQIVTYLGNNTNNTGQSNAVVNDQGVLGYYLLVNNPGFVRKTYKLPEESTQYQYPGTPKLFDQSKSMEKASEVFKYEGPISNDVAFSKVSSSNYDIDGYRHLTDASGNDFNDDHPWSYKLALHPNRIIDFQTYSYPLYPTSSNEIEAIKDLSKIYRYREVGIRHRIEEVLTTNQEVSSVTSNTYRSYSNTLTQTQTITSTGSQMSAHFLYPDSPEVSGESQYAQMTAINQIASPVMVTNYEDGVVVAVQKTNFSQQQNGYKPSEVLTSKNSSGQSNLEQRMVYESYDDHGNITQVRKTNGQPTAYLWGYNKQYPVAKVENATIAEVITALEVSIVTLQNLDGTALQVELDKLRENLPNTLVTSYTYKPLVGVTSVTDPRGYTMYYQYDAQNRLEYVKDQDEKVLSKNEYHYGINN